MRRVYAMWIARQLTCGIALKAYTAVVLAVALSHYVSFGNVIENAPVFPDVPAWAAFSSAALLNTEGAAQIIFALFSAVILWFAKDIFLQNRQQTFYIGRRA